MNSIWAFLHHAGPFIPPFPQAVLSSYVINVNECLEHNPAEGVRFAEVMTQMESLRNDVIPEEIDETVRVLTVE